MNLRAFLGIGVCLLMVVGVVVSTNPKLKTVAQKHAPSVVAKSAVQLAGGRKELEKARAAGDERSQRRYMWALLNSITAASHNQVPAFESWHGEADIFGPGGSANPRGIHGFSRNLSGPDSHSAGVPVIAYTLYNDAAYSHILANDLNSKAKIERLRTVGERDEAVEGDRAVPQFPSDAIIVKTVWWPIAKSGITPIPVWDSDKNSYRKAGNPYFGWKRFAGVAAQDHYPGERRAISFGDQPATDVEIHGLNAFYHVRVNADLAGRLMKDRESSKTILLTLGRPIQDGDELVLVSANIMSRELRDWIWGAFWWHDNGEGRFATGRPSPLREAWRHYLMDVTFDAELPKSPDGSARVAFNPWLEGRFPDGGQGSGRVSNCLACHERASYPPVDFLPVTRGRPDLSRDPAYGPGRLRTGFVWALAMHAND